MMRLPAPAAAPKAVDDQSCSFIMQVQHMIEKCLLLYLDQEECAKALQTHAHIDPIITRTVWKELELTNKEFFEAYHYERVSRMGVHFDRVVHGTPMKLARQSLKDISNKVEKDIVKP